MNELEAVAAAAQTDKTAELIDLTNDEYHARPEWSNSQLKVLPDDPLLFHGRHITKTMPGPSSPTMDMCSDVHRVLLDGAELVEIPRTALTSNGQRRGRQWDAFKAEHADTVLVKENDPLLRIVESVRSHPMARALLESEGPAETSIVWTDEDTGLELRARPDKLCWLKQNWLVDLKGSKEPGRGVRNFAKEIATFQYHRQLAFYGDGVAKAFPDRPIDEYVFIAFRHGPPYDVWVHRLKEEAVMLGHDQNRAALDDLKARLASGVWTPPDYEDAYVIDLPAWAYKENENE